MCVVSNDNLSLEESIFNKNKVRIERVLKKALETDYYSQILNDIDVNSLTYTTFKKYLS